MPKTKKSPQQRADLRCCASCEWLFKASIEGWDCPQCHFGATYGGRFVYGDKAYQYQYNQQPWFDNQIEDYRCKLYSRIKEHNPIKKPKNSSFKFLTEV